MPSERALDPAGGGARAELIALAAGGEDWSVPLRELPAPASARPAAVLILFGVLDAVPSAHDAQDAAVSRELDVLLLERATTLRAHPGQVAFPGGRLDPGDAGPIAAALREAEEETGLDPAGVEVLGALPSVPLEFSGHLVTPVLGWWRHPSPVRVVDDAESAAVFRAPVADLLDPRNRAVTVIERDGRVWRGPAFEVQGHLVWGFTAMLLDALFDRLGWTEPWDLGDRTRRIPLPS
ncbi:NUDIX hydrolase [Microbacterium hominis]|uniref:NUDIX hydrolase n=1 Tax=Microbacterium hominis TaxID=162426 RepID=UPI0007686272|nr:CoA pyrophosphatase [Microbacterium hominis]KXC05675.1 coenzyme A pyrophosphatase [Microbacterium hominis]